MSFRYLLLIFLLTLNTTVFPQTVIDKLSDLLNSSIKSTNNDNVFLHTAPEASIQEIIYQEINELTKAGKYFKYFGQLKDGRFKIKLGNNNFFLLILKNKNTENPFSEFENISSKAILKNEIVDIIEFKFEKFDKYWSVHINNLISYLNINDYLSNSENIEVSNSSAPIQHNFRERIIIDKEIANLTLLNPLYPNLGKTLNRSITRQRLRDPDDQPCDLFADATAGTLIPQPLGTGSPKVLIVDKVWDRIIMMDRDIVGQSNTAAISYPTSPGYYYSLSCPTDITQGAKRVSYYGIYIDSVISMYITDHCHDRIGRVDYVMQYTDDENGVRYNQSYIKDATFRILTNNCNLPYGLAIHKGVNLNDSTDDVLWYSEGTEGNKKLVCINAITGQFIQQVRNLRDQMINPSRISVYRSPDGQRNLMAFIDEESNTLGILKLETNGTFVNTNLNIRYLQDFGIIKLKSVILSSYNNGLDGVSIWTVGDGGNGLCFGQTHCGGVSTLKVSFLNNFPVNIEYLATTWKGFNSSNSFVNIQNLYSENGSIDIATMEKWSDNFGLRRYKPGVDIISTEITPYCYPAEYCTYKVKLTNPAKVKFKGQYKPAGGQWQDYGIYVNNVGPDPVLTLPSGTNELVIRRISSGSEMTDREELKVIAEYIPLDENTFQNNSNKITIEKISAFSSCNSGGGCPYVFINNGSEFVQDNNILHRSEFDENIGRDIEDKYLLRISPFINQTDSTSRLKIKELNQDLSHFDNFKLVAIDHPIGTNLAITEKNDYVLYFPSITLSPESAEHNGEDVTSELNYDSSYDKIIYGDKDDEVAATFPLEKNLALKRNIKNALVTSLKGLSYNLNKKYPKNVQVNKDKNNRNDFIFTDSVAILIDPSASDRTIYVVPPIKKSGGEIFAFDSFTGYEAPEVTFAKRQNSSPVLTIVGCNVNIDSVVSIWNSDFDLSYMAVTQVFYEGYIENQLEFVEAIDSLNGDILPSLQYVDQNYSDLDSTTNITLKFKNTFGDIPAGFVRNYILITTGKYENAREENDGPLSSNQNENLNLPKEYKLYQNYPNPFNPATKINYDLPKNGNVNLIIYDILGREISRIINNELKTAGRYTFDFNGSNLASGIYFYRLESNNFIQTKRMVLIK